MKPQFFATPNDLRQWFIKNHKTEEELILGYYKKSTGIPSVDWSQSVDEALCFGWIDGRRNSIDEQSYQIRFTPRRARSHWSAVNIDKIKVLLEKGLMYPAGMEVWEKRDKKNQKKASFEQKSVQLSPSFEKRIKSHEKAWDFFDGLAPSYKKHTIHWVMSAKKMETQERRLEVLIECSAKGERIPHLNWKKK